MPFRILIADDEKRIVEGMRQVIEDALGEKAEVKTVASGLECVQCMKMWDVNFLITDIRMPGMSGVELVRTIREKNYKTEILVISAYEDFNYAKQLIPYGVLDYIVKPISVEQILSKIKYVMEKEDDKKEDVKEYIKEDAMHVNTMVKEAKDYINREIYSPISLADVAEYLHVNKSYLSTTFKNETGENISSYINDEKIKAAKKMLFETDMTIAEISEQLGYNTPKYFIEKFSKSTGITPAKFRGLLNKSIK